jgi:hypothetical protein
MQMNFSNDHNRSDLNTEFMKQITTKLTMLKVMSDSIMNSIEIIDQSIKYINIILPGQ